MSARLLIVEDEAHQARGLQLHLELDGHQVDVAASGAEALDRDLTRYELVLCDLRLPDMGGLEVFQKATELHGQRRPTFVILTAYGTVEVAREALKAGVYDFLTKPVDATELSVLVEQVVEKRRLARENRELASRMEDHAASSRLVGESEPFRRMLELARTAAESEATILIRGESGTGKELVAELIHQSSPRRDGPFVKVNCAAIPEPLLEAELFGHEKGAFTDAYRARQGRFELAGGGTIFLDEIGDMSPALQVKLLRVLQERELERLGGQGKVIPLDFRLVAATNRDLEALVAERRFREDLYYRINVITVLVPPLRERLADVEPLASAFCARFSHKNNKSFRGISPEALRALLAHDWPGNVRELENVIERAVVLGQGDRIELEHLGQLETPPAQTPQGADLLDRLISAEVPLADIEQELIRHALEQARGNVSKAARLLGLTRRTLQYRMSKYELGSTSR
ncbi:MAG: sigma-54-dependent transcriptional regulator [Planctomycetota bacterium]